MPNPFVLRRHDGHIGDCLGNCANCSSETTPCTVIAGCWSFAEFVERNACLHQVNRRHLAALVVRYQPHRINTVCSPLRAMIFADKDNPQFQVEPPGQGKVRKTVSGGTATTDRLSAVTGWNRRLRCVVSLLNTKASGVARYCFRQCDTVPVPRPGAVLMHGVMDNGYDWIVTARRMR